MIYKRGKVYWYNFRWSIKQAGRDSGELSHPAVCQDSRIGRRRKTWKRNTAGR